MAAYAQFGHGYHPPPTQFFSRSGLQVPPSLTAHIISGGSNGDNGAQSPVATTSSAPSTSPPPLTIGRTDSGSGGIGIGSVCGVGGGGGGGGGGIVVGGGCSSSGNNSNSSGGATTIECGGSSTPELISQSSTTTLSNEAAICPGKSLIPPPPTEIGGGAGAGVGIGSGSGVGGSATATGLPYPYQSCNTSNLTAALHPTVSCCDNGRPVMTDPVSGQMICSCQYDPTRFTALTNYTRIQSAAGIGVYGTPYPSNEQNPYPSIGIESPPFYSSVTHPYALKDNTGAGDVTPWTSGGLQGSASYYTYDPTFGAYGYGAGYDLAARRKNATRESTATLKAWLNEHKKNPYPTKGEKIMLAIITKMTLTQVSTWFANARRRLKKENKMTWEPKNRTEEDDDALVSDDEKDHDESEITTATATPTPTTAATKNPTTTNAAAAAAALATNLHPTKQSNYSYDARTTLPNGIVGIGGAGIGIGIGARIPDPAAIPCVDSNSNVGGSGCVGNGTPVSLTKYSSGNNGGDGTATAPTDPDVVGVMTNVQPKEHFGLPYQIRDESALETSVGTVPLYPRVNNYQQQESYHSPLSQPLSGAWRSAATPYTPYMDWSRLHPQRGPPLSPSGTSVVATISLQSTSPLEMRSNVYGGAATATSPGAYQMPGNQDSIVKREPSDGMPTAMATMATMTTMTTMTTPQLCRNMIAPTYSNANDANDGDIIRKRLYCT